VGEELADPVQLANWAERAAHLCKADLVTEMVGEFPELQGLMGGYYARAEGLPDEVADAIRDHYKPVGQGDLVPTAPVTVAVSLADKLDTLVGFFGIEERPSGSRDPFALRRAALGIISLILRNNLRLSLRQTWEDHASITAVFMTEGELQEIASAMGLETWQSHRIEEDRHVFLTKDGERVTAEATAEYLARLQVESAFFHAAEVDPLDFFADRLKVQQREAGVRHDLIDAVFACQKEDGGNEDDLVRLLARVNALQNFIKTDDGANLLVAYKRAANILKKENWHGKEGEIARTGEEDPLALVDDPELKPVVEARMAEMAKKELSYSPEPAEKELIKALEYVESAANGAVASEDFDFAMRVLASLRAPIDRFFDTVTVNDSDPAKRSARLDLLARFRDAVHQVANFSKIEG
jgi:glycyl-tRNA synthetase beta chain